MRCDEILTWKEIAVACGSYAPITCIDTWRGARNFRIFSVFLLWNPKVDVLLLKWSL